MEFKAFYKNNNHLQWGDVLHEIAKENKARRAKSRHEMRQTFRNMANDSEEENDTPQHQQPQLPQESIKKDPVVKGSSKPLSEEERYRMRLQRFEKYRQEKLRLQQENKLNKKAPFMPFVPKTVVEPKQEPAVCNVRTKKPLGENLQCTQTTRTPGAKTPGRTVAHVKPRVDCWRMEKSTNAQATEKVAPKNPPSKKKIIPSKSATKPPQAEPKRIKQPVLHPKKPIQSARHAGPSEKAPAQKSHQKKPVFKLKINAPPAVAGNGTTNSTIFTSTVRKNHKPLTFSFEPASNVKKDKKCMLNVIKTHELFDGISPIEVESPQASKGLNASPISRKTEEHNAEGDSIWDPQPVASLSTHEVTNIHDTVKPIESTIFVTKKSKEAEQNDGNISEWLPTVAHEFDGNTIVLDDDDEVFDDAPLVEPSNLVEQDVRKRKPALNESFTISVSGDSSNDRPSIGAHIPTEIPPPQMAQLNDSHATAFVNEIVPNEIIVLDNSSPEEDELNGSKTKKRFTWNFTEEPLKDEIELGVASIEQSDSSSKETTTKKRDSLNFTEEPLKHEIRPSIDNIVQCSTSPKGNSADETQTKRQHSPSSTEEPLNAESQQSAETVQQDELSLTTKRVSWNFNEQTLDSEIVPSKSNLSVEEKIRLSSVGSGDDVAAVTISNTPPSSSRLRRRSSVRISGPVVSCEEPEDIAPPKEVQEKTRFYYDKVDSELNRLQGLCEQYAPFLEESHELNDHCRGLILAAQGQTNILIKKKLTKFRELIGHYEQKWNDRKVRHDDLDGFWLMVSLDLDNLNKRFEELRLLKENCWQELAKSPEPAPKAKKLRAGGGVRKREKKQTAVGGAGKKASSSVIADLIRKARQEKQKQKTTVEDLETLKETVTVVTTPVKRSVRFGKSPKRSSGQQRFSMSPGGTPTVIHWEQEAKPMVDLQLKRRTIFADLTTFKEEDVKSILKRPKIKNGRRAKSVLFLDSGLDTPPTRRRHASRSIVDTPKPKIKFNDELEIEHIDNLAARTPSRLDLEIQKRLQQSLLLNGSAIPPSESDDTDEERKKQGRKVYARGTPRRISGSAAGLRRSSRRSASHPISDPFDDEASDNKEWCNGLEGSARRSTRSSSNARKKLLD